MLAIVGGTALGQRGRTWQGCRRFFGEADGTGWDQLWRQFFWMNTGLAPQTLTSTVIPWLHLCTSGTSLFRRKLSRSCTVGRCLSLEISGKTSVFFWPNIFQTSDGKSQGRLLVRLLQLALLFA